MIIDLSSIGRCQSISINRISTAAHTKKLLTVGRHSQSTIERTIDCRQPLWPGASLGSTWSELTRDKPAAACRVCTEPICDSHLRSRPLEKSSADVSGRFRALRVAIATEASRQAAMDVIRLAEDAPIRSIIHSLHVSAIILAAASNALR